jgi:hypothetical protein
MPNLSKETVYGAINWVLVVLVLAVVYASFSGTFQSSPQTVASSQERPQTALATTQEQPKTNSTLPQGQQKTVVPPAAVQSPTMPSPPRTGNATKPQTSPAETRAPIEPATPANDGMPFQGIQHFHPPYVIPSTGPNPFGEGF